MPAHRDILTCRGRSHTAGSTSNHPPSTTGLSHARMRVHAVSAARMGGKRVATCHPCHPIPKEPQWTRLK